ncbi:MAG: hypothetical protein ACRCYJ_11500, partial [Plesiomonas shigelloides]
MLGKQRVFAHSTHELTILRQQNLICNTVQLVTLGDAEYKSRYYTEIFYLITLLNLHLGVYKMILINSNGANETLKPSEFTNELELEDIICNNPQLLCTDGGSELYFLKRQVTTLAGVSDA